MKNTKTTKSFEQVCKEIEDFVSNNSVQYSIEEGIEWSCTGSWDDTVTKYIDPEDTEVRVCDISEITAEDVVYCSVDNPLHTNILGVDFIGEISGFCWTTESDVIFTIKWGEK